jgi:hypothetical protein
MGKAIGWRDAPTFASGGWATGPIAPTFSSGVKQILKWPIFNLINGKIFFLCVFAVTQRCAAARNHHYDSRQY